MQYSSFVLAAAAGLVTSVAGHGAITSPTPRSAGTAMKAACGEQVFNNQASDSFGNIQGELQVASTQTDYVEADCNIWQCKGFKFADNSANVQSWTAGQVVPFKFDVRAPHTGTANVSIINTATNSIIGDMLIYYDNFGDNSKTIPANETSFSLTIPSGLETTCATAGACVVQHFWDARSIDQTYESCVDFTIGGDGSSAPVSSVVASSSVGVATQVAVVTPAASSVVSTSKVASPTTLQTLTKSASSAPAATATTAPVTEDDDDEDC